MSDYLSYTVERRKAPKKRYICSIQDELIVVLDRYVPEYLLEDIFYAEMSHLDERNMWKTAFVSSCSRDKAGRVYFHEYDYGFYRSPRMLNAYQPIDNALSYSRSYRNMRKHQPKLYKVWIPELNDVDKLLSTMDFPGLEDAKIRIAVATGTYNIRETFELPNLDL